MQTSEGPLTRAFAYLAVIEFMVYWLRVFVFENTREHSDASPRVISGGDMRGKATDTRGSW